ncbi:MAG: PEP/pyruvate-binding domain-containing protein [Acidimicrobiales bacterium]
MTSSRSQPLAEGAELQTGDDRCHHRADPDGPFAVVLDAQPSATPGLGGKGTSLETLVASGHPVPATGVVTTAAYRAVASRPEVTELVDAITNGEAPDRDRVDAAFAAVPIDEAVEQEILEVVRAVGDGGPVAVRSSATVEDLAGSSFAGQYRSLLDIDSTDDDDVLTAVRSVWSSLWHPAPSAYRRAFGIDENDVAMAVVVMAMVPATTAGVVFTIDPGGGDGARVEAVEGLGESLVSGERTPSAWVVPIERADRPELPAEVDRALDLALAIEETFGVPQDVEWAAVDHTVYAVQARPITVLDDHDGFDTPIDDHELTTGGIVEMVPGVLPALRWELNRFLLEEAFRSVLDSLGIIRGLAAEDRPFVRRVRGRAAIDFDQLRAAAAGIPGAVAELEHQYFGLGTAAPPAPKRRRRLRLEDLQRDVLTLRTRRIVIEQSDVLIQVTAGLLGRRPTLSDLATDELVAYARRLVDVSGRGLAAELGVAAAAAAAYARLEGLLTKHLGDDVGAAAAQRVTSGGLAARRDPTSSAGVFGGPTWNELDLHPPVPQAPDPDEQARRRAELEAAIRAKPGWRRRRILTGQVVDVRIHVIRRAIDEVVDQLRRREAAKAAVLQLGGEVRRVHLELGARLTEMGVLTSPADVELLTMRELMTSLDLRSASDVEPIRSDLLRRRRNWLSRYESEGALPVRFTGVPDREAEPLPEGRVLEGWGASPGRARGAACVLAGPGDPFDAGGVIVAETTDASWSPLFVRAAAVIVERGGPLSHAAILARELGLPCVMNVQGATKVLAGTSVLVDGDQGAVVIESKGSDDG